jgi:hypothetical protein
MMMQISDFWSWKFDGLATQAEAATSQKRRDLRVQVTGLLSKKRANMPSLLVISLLFGFLLLQPAALALAPPHLLALGTAYLDMDAPMAGAANHI